MPGGSPGAGGWSGEIISGKRKFKEEEAKGKKKGTERSKGRERKE